MRKKLTEVIGEIDAIPSLIRDALMATRSDEEEVDVIGAIKAAERKYKPIVSRATKEMDLDPGIPRRGELHGVEVTRAAERSYNTPRLMAKLQGEGYTLMDLIDQGVVKMSWRYTELNRFCERRGIELDIVGHEVPELGDADGDIGEIWGTSSMRWT